MVLALLTLPPWFVQAAQDPKSTLANAVRRLAESPGYHWKTILHNESSGPLSGGNATTTGAVEKDGYLQVALTAAGPAIEFVRKSGKAAVLHEGLWMTLDQAAERSSSGNRGSTGNAPANAITEFRLPIAQAEEWLAQATQFVANENSVTAALNTETAKELLNAGTRFGGRGGRGSGTQGGRGNPPTLKDPQGSITFTLKDGTLSAYEVTLSGIREFGGNSERQKRTIHTTFARVGNPQIQLHPDAREIVDALVAGRTPEVFVPEPGFVKLFNGRDLTDWSGRSEHWSVRDGAITGISTQEKPARGNNFLIAQSGGTNLVVDDFELRFSYRISANNNSGFANSGIQYRSKDRGNHVVAGYQADFEAGTQFSGILYDEGGGAGGRGIMANRGELVVWNADGNRTVARSLGNSSDIQARIKPNDWNEYVILAQGNRLQHFINGVQTIGVVDETAGKRLTSGVLAIQIHAGEPMTVQCKNIRIKSLSSAEMVGGSNLRLAKDFKIEMLYTVPRETEGSWVAMCVEPKGRLIVSDQNGALHRVTLPTSPGGAVKTEKIGLDIGGAHGLLHAYGSLYVAVNEGSKPHGVYRVQDTDGDDRYDKVELLRQVDASGEHGIHSLVPSPDAQSIYVVIGNQSTLTEMAVSRPPRNWGEDQLLPRLTTGFMDGSYAPQGYIARMDPDGKSWELIAMGLRNEFDVAFDKNGELFTYDADMEWDIGSPWYRPTRVNHVISGADFGFRNGDAKWPAHYMDSFAEVVNIGPGSPTGITFGYGAKFPARYQNALFLADWSFGKVRAVHLSPQDSTYTGEVEDFISGQPFPVTDFLIHPADGSMLLAVGGRGAQSALYRVTYAGSESTQPAEPDTREQTRRDARHALERFHGKTDSLAVEEAWPHLSHPDRAMRFAARIAIEWQDPAHWRDKALNESDPRKAIAALVALIRVSGRDAIHRASNAPPADASLQAAILKSLERLSWNRLTSADRADLLRAYSLAFIRLGPPEVATRQRLATQFEAVFPTKRPELDALLARLLIFLEAPGAASKIVALLQSAPTQEEQIDLAVALRSLKTGWTPALREDYFRWFTRAESYRGGNTFASSIRRAKSEAVALLSESEQTALKPILEAKAERQNPRDLLAARPFVKEWKAAELLPSMEAKLKAGRSHERGRQLYGGLACAACHRFVNEGGSVGPELTGVVGRFGVRDLLESILEPSKVISDQYGAIVIHKKDGESLSGRIANLSAAGVQVVEDMFDPGRMTTVRRADIASMTPSEVSMMPEGLVNSLQEDEVADLLAYLLSRGDPDHPMFR